MIPAHLLLCDDALPACLHACCCCQQVVRVSRDMPLLPLPEAAKRATQQVSRLIATRSQQQQLLRQQQQQQQSPEAAAAADAVQQDAGTDISGPKAQQLGLTRIYTPAPPKGAEASEADRQPLRFMSLRQQQQLREEARRAAVLKVGSVGGSWMIWGCVCAGGGWRSGVVLVAIEGKDGRCICCLHCALVVWDAYLSCAAVCLSLFTAPASVILVPCRRITGGPSPTPKGHVLRCMPLCHCAPAVA